MAEARIVFDHVWKKFRRGQPHDSLRDLVPAMAAGLFRSTRNDDPTGEEFWALKDVSFEVRPGETLGIIGRNGAGKSTTLKLLTRILKPTRGHSAVRGRVGALIELAAGFHPDLTGRENVFLQGAIMGMRRHEISRRFDEIVDFAGVDEFIDTQVKRYSSGMQARLGFSVAAHLDPDVLLIDEVLAVGDLSFQQKCYARLREFRQSGIAIAFVSHNMQAISMLSDRVLYLRPQVPPEIGSVGDMITAYVTSDSKGADSRVTVSTAQLRVNGSVLREPVCPGTELTLTVSLQSNANLPRSGFALHIHRSDGLLIFDGSSLLDGVPSDDLGVDDVATYDVSFKANVLRGTYAVSGLLVDETRIWSHVELGVLGSFVVEETTRWGGVVEVEPRYRVRKEVKDSVGAQAVR
jgi:ABC-type polysaccharide/polyol phosphate transport system ATPase subunit